MRRIEDIKAGIEFYTYKQNNKVSPYQDFTRDIKEYENELKLALCKNIPIERFEEMCKAELDGRCVVLPCKEGDTVYDVLCDDIFNDIFSWKVHGFNVDLHIGAGIRGIDDFGKTLFLTAEEAKAKVESEGK